MCDHRGSRGRDRRTCVGADVDAIDLRPLDLALEVRGDPHGAQRALPREDRVRAEHPRRSPPARRRRRGLGGVSRCRGGEREGDETRNGVGLRELWETEGEFLEGREAGGRAPHRTRLLPDGFRGRGSTGGSGGVPCDARRSWSWVCEMCSLFAVLWLVAGADLL